MAHSKSAKKRVRQNEEQRLRNRHHRSCLRSAIKKLRAAVAAGDQDASKEQLPRTIALLDRMAGRRVIHRNAAARTKSRLSRLVAKS
ncbi:MAG: 30S ribosomal protein S20 [Acidobacteria bacterium]|nr:30S ribosomal protein S20 [Acidobacteriota bacterium]MYF14051.1 30S ribosomal protein S20 [Acidobacteriota bacterium]MYI97453.1 30S ribosomal protein S20 [Acidobacteriota bacterium]